MKFDVDFAVTGYYALRVDAKDKEEAREIANALLCDIDFGALQDIDWDAIHVLDDRGNYVWNEGDE